MKRKDWLIILIVACCTFLITFVSSTFVLNKHKEKEEKVVKQTSSFTIKFIKEVNKDNKSNYIISPYSVETAFSMLRVGANNNTLTELDNVIRDRNTNFSNDKVNIANALFIKDYYENVIEKEFVNTLKNNYNADVLVDEFKTPDVINNWVNDKTNGMIPSIMDSISDDFSIGLANAISIDTKWEYEFGCESTRPEEFINDKEKTKVEMMNKLFEGHIKYIDDDVKGILLPYKDNLEYIAIMPKKDLNGFIDELSDKSLNEYLNSFKSLKEEELYLSLPRYSYEYNLNKFKDILINMGIKDAFSSEKADFSKIVTKDNLKSINKDNIYVDQAIHKAKIELNEEGTKAAAVTAIIMTESASIVQTDRVELTFNKPFMYIIRDTKSHEIIFFGTVYKPNKWEGSTCKGDYNEQNID